MENVIAFAHNVSTKYLHLLVVWYIIIIIEISSMFDSQAHFLMNKLALSECFSKIDVFIQTSLVVGDSCSHWCAVTD